MRTLLYSDSVGPFDVTLFAIVQLIPHSNPSKPGNIIVRWYAGPHFPGSIEEMITGDLFDAIKLLPGRVVEYHAYQSRRGLELETRTIFPNRGGSKSAKDSFLENEARIKEHHEKLLQLGPGDGPIMSSCASFECGEVSPCEPPNNVIDCTVNPPVCTQGEPGLIAENENGKGGCC